MQHSPDSPLDWTPARSVETIAYRLGGPRFGVRDRAYLSIPVACRRDSAGLLTGVALAHARDWLERHDVDPRTPELLGDGLAQIVDLDWPTLFRNGNPAAAGLGRVAFGWRHLIEFSVGDMLTLAVRWGRLGGGRLAPLAPIR